MSNHRNKIYSQEEVLQRFKRVHGDRYDYSMMKYIDSHSNVTIICREHGPFQQEARYHTKGGGCPKCAKNNKKTTVEWIKKAREVHGNAYDYSQSEYISSKDKIYIICHNKDEFGVEHGGFWQVANSHLAGHKCPKCAKRFSDKSSFIAKANSIHKGKYLYDKVDYVNATTKVCIICPEHGEFWQTPNSHLCGRGCKVCANHTPLTAERFIQLANLKHNGKYDYSLITNPSSQRKVKIICPKHGVFEQVANNHLCGAGCPVCKESKGEREIENYLTRNGIDFIRQYKIEIIPRLFSRVKLRVDFYLPMHNMIIEFNGRQHYEYIEAWNKNRDNFGEQRERDQHLREYCRDSGIKLIEIPYTKINNIPRILSKALNIH